MGGRSLIWLVLCACLWGIFKDDAQPEVFLPLRNSLAYGSNFQKTHAGNPITNVPATILNSTLSAPASQPEASTGLFFTSGPWWMYAIPSLFLLAVVLRTSTVVWTIPPRNQNLKAGKSKRRTTVELEANTTLPAFGSTMVDSTIMMPVPEPCIPSHKRSLAPTTTTEPQVAAVTVLQGSVMTAEPEDIGNVRCLRRRRTRSASLQDLETKEPHMQKSTSFDSNLKALKKVSDGWRLQYCCVKQVALTHTSFASRPGQSRAMCDGQLQGCDRLLRPLD